MDTRKIEDVPFEEVHEIQRYGTYFSEKSFWKKIERVAKKVGATVLRPVFTLYYMLQDEKVPLQHKAYIIGALGYFILPFDLIPESVLPIIGFTDDVAVMTFVLKMVKDSITPEIRRKADQKILDLFPDPALIGRYSNGRISGSSSLPFSFPEGGLRGSPGIWPLDTPRYSPRSAGRCLDIGYRRWLLPRYRIARRRTG